MYPSDEVKIEGQEGGCTIILPVPLDYSFDEALVYLGRSAIECMHAVDGRRVYKALRFGGDPIIIEVHNPSQGCIEVRCVHGSPSPNDRHAMANYVVEWLDLHRNLDPFYTMASGEQVLHKLVTRYRGLHVIGIPDLFEALCWAIIGQQINLPFAYTLKRRFVEQFGTTIDHPNGTSALFPTPSVAASLTVGELLPLQFSRRKAEYLIEVAQRIVAGELSKSGLQALTSREAQLSALTKIRGIGAWTAHYVLMRCLHRTDAFPVSDVGLHQAIQRVLGLASKPSLDEVERLFEPWKGWEAYATFYLWRSLYDEV